MTGFPGLEEVCDGWLRLCDRLHLQSGMRFWRPNKADNTVCLHPQLLACHALRQSR
jgi:hypothetical protein